MLHAQSTWRGLLLVSCISILACCSAEMNGTDASTIPDGGSHRDVTTSDRQTPDAQTFDAQAADAHDGSTLDGTGADAMLPPCEGVPGTTYETITISGSPTDRPAAMHGDINLLLRTWSPVAGAAHDLITITGPTDALAPKLNTIFSPARIPALPGVYAVQSWDWGCNCAGALITDPEVTLVGMGTTPGEVIGTPSSGYDIGSGYTAMLLYAGNGTVTLKYTRDDNVVHGYTVHMAGLCIEPRLQALYDASNAAGRSSLPALRGGQTIGRARGTEIQVAIRDTGSWMDPRSRKDWWPP